MSYLFTSRIGCATKYNLPVRATPAFINLASDQIGNVPELRQFIITEFALQLSNNLITTITMLNQTNIYPMGDNPGRLRLSGMMFIREDESIHVTDLQKWLRYVEQEKKVIKIVVGDLVVSFVPQTVAVSGSEQYPALAVTIAGLVLPRPRQTANISTGSGTGTGSGAGSGSGFVLTSQLSEATGIPQSEIQSAVSGILNSTG